VYLRQFDSFQQCCGQCCASTERNSYWYQKGVIFWKHSKTQIEVAVFWTCSQMQSWGAKIFFFLAISVVQQINPKDLGDVSQYLYLPEHFQYWYTNTQWEQFLTPFEKLSEFFFLLHALGCFTAQLYTSTAPLQNSRCWPWQGMHLGATEVTRVLLKQPFSFYSDIGWTIPFEPPFLVAMCVTFMCTWLCPLYQAASLQHLCMVHRFLHLKRPVQAKPWL